MNSEKNQPLPSYPESERRPQEIRRGRLKIFLGYSQGVGKTYAMLESARQRKVEGSNVAIGILDNVLPEETAALADGLISIPPILLNLPDSFPSELDLDAVLKYKPSLVLVDDLAHSNPSGLRHPYRYQDIEEILDAGINVYTTTDIQDFESLQEVIIRMTGEPVKNTVPDRILDEADEIELIDLPPDELLRRLRDQIPLRKISKSTIDRLFSKEKLSTLRELAFKRAALRLDARKKGYRAAGENETEEWASGESLLVCLIGEDGEEYLVRRAYILARELNATWFVVFVEVPQTVVRTEYQHSKLAGTVAIAENLGAQVVSLIGESIQESVSDFIRKNHITRVVALKPNKRRRFLFWKKPEIEALINLDLDVEITLVGNQFLSETKKQYPNSRNKIEPQKYLLNLLFLGIATFLCYLLHPFVHPTNLIFIFIGAVIMSAIFLGRGPSITASFISVLVFDFFFVEPPFSLSVVDTEYLITFFGLISIGLVISGLTSVLRDQIRSSQQRASQTSALNALNRDLTAAMTLEEMLQAVVKHTSLTLNREVAVLIPENGALKILAATGNITPNDKEMDVARWVFEHAKTAGRGTTTHPDLSIRFVPMATVREISGVLAVQTRDVTEFLTPSQRQLMESFASLGALAIERARLSEEANRVQVLAAAEKLQTALLNSISHDLRTPLVSIQGVLESLLETDQGEIGSFHLNKADRLDMIENAREETLRLNRLVENLLDITRIEAGALRIKLDEGDIQDVIGSALAHFGDRIKDHPVDVTLAQDIPLVMFDSVLMEQVIINLLDNAVKYSSPKGPLEIKAYTDENNLIIEVSDRGIGIPEQELEHIFDKFYRVRRPEGREGTGLGLSICKGMVEAHNGIIMAERRKGAGTTMRINLPLQKRTVVE